MRHSDIINEMFDILGGNVDSVQADGFVSLRAFLEPSRRAGSRSSLWTEFHRGTDGRRAFSENIW